MIKHGIKEAERVKSEEQEAVQTALKALGLCCMGYEWLPQACGGYRCAGGSHFCSAEALEKEMNKK